MNEQVHGMEAEQAVIGAVLIESDALHTALERIGAEDFEKPALRIVFENMVELSEMGMPIDLITLVERLQDKQQLEIIGSVSYLTQLANAVPTAANVGYYAGIVRQKSLLRKAQRTLTEQLTAASETTDSRAFIAELQSVANELADEVKPEREFVRVSKVVEGHEDLLEKRSKQKGLVGVKTAGTDLDKLTGGRQKGDLIIVAARPSIGKTAFMLNESRHAAATGTAVGIFSIEMPAVAISERLIASIGNIDGMKIRTGMLDAEEWDRYTRSRQYLSELPIYIDDTPGTTIQEIGAKVKRLKRQHANLLIQIDYMQLISGGKKFSSREAEMSFISRSLKRIARENEVPVVAISSLSRSCEQRQDKRPMLSDLRESGQIEFDADEVDFLYRDDYYNAETSRKNIVEVIVAKGRNTGTGIVEMAYLKNYSKFLDLDRSQFQQPPRQQQPEDSRKREKRRWA